MLGQIAPLFCSSPGLQLYVSAQEGVEGKGRDSEAAYQKPRVAPGPESALDKCQVGGGVSG